MLRPQQRCILGWISELPNPAEARIAATGFCPVPSFDGRLCGGNRPKNLAGRGPWTRKGGFIYKRWMMGRGRLFPKQEELK